MFILMKNDLYVQCERRVIQPVGLFSNVNQAALSVSNKHLFLPVHVGFEAVLVFRELLTKTGTLKVCMVLLQQVNTGFVYEVH